MEQSGYHHRVVYSLEILTHDGERVELPPELLSVIFPTPLSYSSAQREDSTSYEINASDGRFQSYLSIFRGKIKDPSLRSRLEDAATIIINKKCIGCEPIRPFSKS